MARESFDTNLMKVIAAELYFIAGMQAAREMYSKSYFALGGPEKVAVDQAVVTHVGTNFQNLVPELFQGQSFQQAVGFQAPGAEPTTGS